MAKILLVDDEPQVAKALARLLRRGGFEVELAASGAEALEKLSSFQADAVISDFRMPGMTGAELLAIVKKSQPLALRIILSGFADLRSILTSINEGEICRFLTKPWDDEQLLLLMRRLLTERDLLAALYQPFREPIAGISSQALQQESRLMIKLERPGEPFLPAQVAALLSSFTGALADNAFEVVGGLLERSGGTVSLVAQVGARAELRLEVPISANADTAERP